jgi:hypothetical protein
MPSEMSRNPTAATQDERRLIYEIGIRSGVDRRVGGLEDRHAPWFSVRRSSYGTLRSMPPVAEWR